MSDFDRMEAEVDAWMQQFAKIDDRRRPLPDAGALWIKARLLQSTAAMERASRPITRVQMGAYVVVAATWAALLTWKWNALAAWIGGFSPAKIFLGSPAAASLSMTFLMMLIALASVTVMLAFHMILAEE